MSSFSPLYSGRKIMYSVTLFQSKTYFLSSKSFQQDLELLVCNIQLGISGLVCDI